MDHAKEAIGKLIVAGCDCAVDLEVAERSLDAIAQVRLRMVPIRCQNALMKNIQIIDGAVNATFSVFQATAEEFEAIFPDGREMELVEDLINRLGEDAAGAVLAPLWDCPTLKRDALGIHGTLFYDNEDRRADIPPSKPEVDWHTGSVNQAQRDLFARCR